MLVSHSFKTFIRSCLEELRPIPYLFFRDSQHRLSLVFPTVVRCVTLRYVTYNIIIYVVYEYSYRYVHTRNLLLLFSRPLLSYGTWLVIWPFASTDIKEVTYKKYSYSCSYSYVLLLYMNNNSFLCFIIITTIIPVLVRTWYWYQTTRTFTIVAVININYLCVYHQKQYK